MCESDHRSGSNVVPFNSTNVEGGKSFSSIKIIGKGANLNTKKGELKKVCFFGLPNKSSFKTYTRRIWSTQKSRPFLKKIRRFFLYSGFPNRPFWLTEPAVGALTYDGGRCGSLYRGPYVFLPRTGASMAAHVGPFTGVNTCFSPILARPCGYTYRGWSRGGVGFGSPGRRGVRTLKKSAGNFSKKDAISECFKPGLCTF